VRLSASASEARRRYSKFSWEKGAVPMPTKSDGSLDKARIGIECFTRKPMGPGQMRGLFKRQTRHVNSLRVAIDKNATLLDVSKIRVHSLRHGVRAAPLKGWDASQSGSVSDS
jgi:hypothetical protein